MRSYTDINDTEIKGLTKSYDNFISNCFKVTSILTDKYPKTGSLLLNKTAGLIAGNRAILQYKISKDISKLKNIDNFNKILIIGDLNIGDALNIQAVAEALKNFLNGISIDYIVNPLAKNLIFSDYYNISHIWTFPNIYFNNNANLELIAGIIKKNHYNLILNFCPFLNDGFFNALQIQNITINGAKTMVYLLVHNEMYTVSINHITYQLYHFIDKLFNSIAERKRNSNFKGVNIIIEEDAFSKAFDLLNNFSLVGKKIVLYHTDATSRFTRIPLEKQIAILRYIASNDSIESILLGAGHNKKDIEYEIMNCLDKELRRKFYIIDKNVSLEVYSALIDFSKVFITPDTGVLHIAAAKKYSKSKYVKNKTAIVSVFGATPARIYGYESKNPLFFDSNQNAPSKVFIADSPCRNITCINKKAKTCKEVRCFSHLNIKQICNTILKYTYT